MSRWNFVPVFFIFYFWCFGSGVCVSHSSCVASLLPAVVAGWSLRCASLEDCALVTPQLDFGFHKASPLFTLTGCAGYWPGKSGQDGLSCKEEGGWWCIVSFWDLSWNCCWRHPTIRLPARLLLIFFLSSSYLSLFPTLVYALIPSSQWWFCMNLLVPRFPYLVTGVIHHYCQGGNVCGWVQRSMTSSFEWTSLDWLFSVKDPFRKYLWQLFRWFSGDSQWDMTFQPSMFARTIEESLRCSLLLIFYLSILPCLSPFT